MARTLVRLENLSFILAWTEQDPRDPKGTGYDPPIHFVEMPRLLLGWTEDGLVGEWQNFGGLDITIYRKSVCVRKRLGVLLGCPKLSSSELKMTSQIHFLSVFLFLVGKPGSLFTIIHHYSPWG